MSEPASRVAVVAGGGSGIGRATALELAAVGYSLALLGRRREPLEAVLGQSGARGIAFAGDVRDADTLSRFAGRVANELGPAEVVMAAAGVARVGSFVELSAESFRETVETNLLGTGNLFRQFLPTLLARGRGTLVALLSVAARQVFPGWSAYAASKWGVLGLVESLRVELRGSGVRLLAVSPGATATPLWDEVAGEWDRERMIPAQEVARAIVWSLAEREGMGVDEIRLQPLRGDL